MTKQALVRVRVATYQSVSGAGAIGGRRLRNESPDEHDLRMDWDYDGEEFEEESKLRTERARSWSSPNCRSRPRACACR